MRRPQKTNLSNRLRGLAAGVAVAAGVVTAASTVAAAPGALTVFKSPYCGCCEKWVDYMRAQGFEVIVRDMEDLSAVKKMAGVPENLESCHTATLDGRIIEGHVPVEAVRSLLNGDNSFHGLAVPGMPSGSPGMEGGAPEPYVVFGFYGNGDSEVFMPGTGR